MSHSQQFGPMDGGGGGAVVDLYEKQKSRIRTIQSCLNIYCDSQCLRPVGLESLDIERLGLL